MTRSVTIINKKVACKPFETSVVEKEIKNGFALVKQKVKLDRLQVVFGDGHYCDYSQGDFALIKGEFAAASWAKEIYDLDGVKFILVPYDNIIGFIHESDNSDSVDPEYV